MLTQHDMTIVAAALLARMTDDACTHETRLTLPFIFYFLIFYSFLSRIYAHATLAARGPATCIGCAP